MPAVLLPQFYVKLNGSDVPSDFVSAIEFIEVDISLYMPGMATIQLTDHKLKWVDDASVEVGSDIEISIRETATVGETPPGPTVVFKGKIAALEPTYHADDFSCVTVIRAYDRLHQLHRGAGSKTYLNAKDSEVVQAVIGEAGLSARVESTSTVREHIFRGDLSSYDFIQALAHRNGFVTFCEGDTVHWKPPLGFNFPAHTISHGEGLIDFRPVLSTTGQVDTVEVQGWNPTTKQAITASATSTTSRLARNGSAPNGGPALAASKFTSAKLHVSDHTRLQPEADRLAAAVFARMAAGDITAEGAAIGSTRIKPGVKLTVQNVGTRFNGTYLVTRARHRYTPTDAYQTEFWLGGMTSGTVGAMLNDDPTDANSRSRLTQGLVVGIVTNNDDPDKLARVKVKFPWLSANEESGWAPVMSVGAGNARGFQVIPEVNDEVLVAFANGDFNQPYILGGVWNGQDAPPSNAAVANGSVDIREFKTRAGHILRFTDKSGGEKIEILDKTGKNTIVIDSATNEIAINAEGVIKVIAKQDVKIQASANVEIKGDASVKVSGPQINVEASGKLTLKGASVEINGSGNVKIGGPVVQIN